MMEMMGCITGYMGFYPDHHTIPHDRIFGTG